MKIRLIPVLTLVTALTFIPAASVMAKCGGPSCPKSSQVQACVKKSSCEGNKSCPQKKPCKKKCKKSLEDKVMCKAKFFKSHAESMGLSEEQVDQIKELKRAAKKDVVMKKAQIEVLAIDIRSLLKENPIDVKAANELVEKKYKLKKEKTKNLVQAMADIKGVLSEEQYAKAKEIWQAK